MIDIHTHFLPAIDDGSRNVEESTAMLKELARQGVTKVVATPHFYPECVTPEHFLSRRNRAYEQLKPNLTEDMPEISLGAEVKYFDAIVNSTAVHDLCMEGTQMLLLEMPVMKWTDRMIRTLYSLGERDDLTILMAHIERYMPYQSRNIWSELIRHGLLLQLSAAAFTDRKESRFAMKCLKKGMISFIGTDTHNMGPRKPNMAPAVEEIKHKLGEETFENFRIHTHHLWHELHAN